MAMMQKWEYRFEPIDLKADDKLTSCERQLNSLGDTGWELVQVVKTHSDRFIAVLRRPAVSELPLS